MKYRNEIPSKQKARLKDKKEKGAEESKTKNKSCHSNQKCAEYFPIPILPLVKEKREKEKKITLHHPGIQILMLVYTFITIVAGAGVVAVVAVVDFDEDMLGIQDYKLEYRDGAQNGHANR